MEPLIKVNNVNKYFHDPFDIQVLKNISLSMNQGEFVSIMGKSGCGKSTLLYILSTMDTDYTGEVYLKNQRLSGLTHNELAVVRNEHIGFVFQFHYLLPEFSVLKNVMMPALKLGRKSEAEIEHDAMEKLKLLDIQDQSLKMASQISGGQKQRVSIARALVSRPRLILADEPTAALDSKSGREVVNLMCQLAYEQKCAILIVTHDNRILDVANRRFHVEDGYLSEEII